MITREQVQEAEHEYKEARQRLHDLRIDFARQKCPFEVGDIVDVCGNTHRGKKMKITGIFSPSYSLAGDWKAVGNVIKKNGEVGQTCADFDQKNWEHHK